MARDVDGPMVPVVDRGQVSRVEGGDTQRQGLAVDGEGGLLSGGTYSGPVPSVLF